MAARRPTSGRTTPRKPRVTVNAANEVEKLKARVYDLSAQQQQIQVDINACNQRIVELSQGRPAPVEEPPTE